MDDKTTFFSESNYSNNNIHFSSVYYTGNVYNLLNLNILFFIFLQKFNLVYIYYIYYLFIK